MPKDCLIVKIQGMSCSDNIFQRYHVPRAGADNPWRTEFTIRKSLFITRSFHCENADSVRDYVWDLKRKEPDASHHCWAFAAGAPGNTARIGCSDDGEPHGTAGKPMLNMLLHSGIGQICTVTSRWFGGIKLGTGGLVRAYQDSVRLNLENMPVIELVPRELWSARFDYQYLDAAKRVFKELETDILEEIYKDKAEFLLNVPLSNTQFLVNKLAILSNGTACLGKSPDLEI